MDCVLPAAEVACEWHDEQAPEPATSLNLPASHAWQGPISGPVYPVLHWQDELPADEVATAEQGLQVDLLTAPATTEYLPASHLTHSPLPGSSLKVPAGHGAQGEPENPAEHPRADPAAGDCAEKLHVRAPLSEDLPAGQAVHSVLPHVSLKVFAGHRRQLMYLCPPSSSQVTAMPGGHRSSS